MTEYRFKMPDIGEGVVEAEITAWHVSIGDKVEEDQPIADAMTDKATIELTAPVSGQIKALGCEAGDMLAVGADLAVFETDDDIEDTEENEASVNVPAPVAPVSGGGTFIFKMPDIGEGVVEAEITAWHITEGDKVEEDQPVADAMTDKATIELTAPVSGIAAKLGCGAGDIIAVGADLVVFEGVEGITTSESTKKPPLKPTTKKPAPNSKSQKIESKQSGRALASPAIRKRAKDAGIDLAKVKSSGQSGNITHADLDMFEKALAPLDGENRIKIIGMRRIIAERMQASKRHIPHFTYVEEMDMTNLEAMRQRLNAKKRDEQPKLTVLPFIIRAMISAIREWPQMNARYNDEQGFLSQFSPVHLGIATQTDQGLMVPVIRNAQSLSIWQTSTEIVRLAESARNALLTKDELTGATTTLTSLGPLGGIVTTPVINRPEVAIFGPNKIRPKLVLDGGDVKERLVMNFSISCDHRIIDGYDAALMMQYIKSLLEDPMLMFLE